MRRVLLLGILLLLPLPPLRAEDDESEPPALEQGLQERVNAAIDKGVAWLKSVQGKDGSWGPCHGSGQSYDGRSVDPIAYHTGPTSFALFTLARCGTPRRDKCVRKGMKWLRDMESSKHEFTSYESSSLVLMLTALYDSDEPLEPTPNVRSKPRGSPFPGSDWKWLDARIQHLVGPKGCKYVRGGWGYRPNDGHQDLSATQFALLALRAAARAGYPVESVCPKVWTDALEFTRGLQTPSGALRYTTSDKWTAGMTAAGLANLLICRERLETVGETPPDWLEERVDRALEALGRMYRPTINVQDGGAAAPYYHYCYLYAVERVGALSGKHLLGGMSWYANGAGWFLSQQRDDGAWEDRTCMGPQDVLGTCFALLFLKKATPPVAITPSGD